MKFKIITLIFMLLDGIGSSIANPNDIHGSFALNINYRPAVPYPALDNFNTRLTESGRGPSYTVEVSRHHIIPFNLLRSFYNRVSENNRLTNLSGFLNTYSDNVRLYASSNGIDCSRLGNDLFNAGNLAQGQSTGWTIPGGGGMPYGFDTFEQFYAWLPGNLFIGPNNRSDDPSEGFESNAHVIVGTDTFDVLSRLNANMNRYIATNDAYLLNSISSDLSIISKRRSIYELKANNWDLKNGKYSIKPSGKSIYSISNVKLNDTCESQKPNISNIIYATIL